MIYRARAPLRLGLAGGGTDLSPYCETFGGAVLNATIDLYAYVNLRPLSGNEVIFEATDGEISVADTADANAIAIADPLALHKAVYKRIVTEYRAGQPFPCHMRTYCEAPPGSGLGSSSTLVVAMIKAFTEVLQLPLGDYDMARLAFDIERVDAGFEGGRQDQYAAAFGGFNFIEFGTAERVIVNPLRIKNWILSELESSIVLFYTGQSRASANIIAEQVKNISGTNHEPIDAMHQLKADAYSMKECVLTGNIQGFAEVLNRSWTAKRATAKCVSNKRIDGLMELAFHAGAVAGKVSGAGGGGFITFIADPSQRMQLIRRLGQEEGQVITCSFTKRGTEGWRIE